MFRLGRPALGRIPASPSRTHKPTPTLLHQIPQQHTNPPPSRNMSTPTPTSHPNPTSKPSWSPTQYLKFTTERTRPATDLLTRCTPHISSPTPTIEDLGCGPGNSTATLLATFPDAKNITGMDSSPDMLRRARATVPGAHFVRADLATYDPGAGTDLLFSNAVFHWLRSGERVRTLVRLFTTGLKEGGGGVMGVQVPDNYYQASHVLMREVASAPDKAWSTYFADCRIGDLGDGGRPDLDPIEAPATFYDALVPHARSVDIWRTEYQHVLRDAGAIVEWVKGTGLQPYLHRIGDEGAKKAFLDEYERRLGEAYPKLSDGKVLLGYPRLFIVAVRK